MKGLLKKIEEKSPKAPLLEHEGVEELRNGSEEVRSILEATIPEIPHAEPGELQAVKDLILWHGEQAVLPDDCQFGDNDLCFVEA